MKNLSYVMIFVVFIALIQACATTEKKVASVKVGDGAFSSGSPEGLGAWLTYGSARSKFIKCGGYLYSFEEELAGRKAMAEFWLKQKTKNPELQEPYLDTLAVVNKAGYISEYVWFYFFNKQHQEVPVGLNMPGFAKWQKASIPNHKPETNVSVVLDKNACKNT